MTKWIEHYRRLDDLLRTMPDDVEPTPPPQAGAPT
jgi:hypothetical protein